MIRLAVVLTGYMVLLAAVAVASPGVGFSGAAITFIPDGWRDGAHVPAYGLLGWLTIQAFRLRGWPLPYAILCGTLLAVVFGLWTEVAQGSAPGRETSLHDLVNDALGGTMAGALVMAQYLWSYKVPGVRPSVAGHCSMKGVPSR